MASSIRGRLELQLALANERIRGLEAQVALLSKALEQSLSHPAVVYGSDHTNPSGPGFHLLSQQALANVDETPEPTPPIAPAVTWFRADGGDPAEKVLS